MMNSTESEIDIKSMNNISEFQNCYVIQWVVENFSKCLQKKGEGLESPPFKEETSHNQEWSMILYPRGYYNEAFIEFELKNKVKVWDIFIFTVSIIDSSGFPQFSKEIATILIKVDQNYIIPNFIKRKDLCAEKISLLPNDILTLQCIIRKSSKLHRSIQSFKFEKSAFTWPIKNFSTMEPMEAALIYPLKVNLKDAPNLIWHFGFIRNSTGESEICLKLKKTTNDNDCSVLISFEISATNINGFMFVSWKDEHIFSASSKEEIYSLPHVKINKLFHGESGNLPTDTLLLLINYQISNGSHELKQQSFTVSDYLQPCKLNPSNTTLSEKLYKDKKFCDVVLKVGNESLAAHKAVLHSQSPVFEAMLESDMAEKNTGVINIVDFDVDTIKHLLQLLYTEKLDETLSCEDILNVYAAAHKYEVESLKYVSSLLISKITIENIQKVVSCAAVYDDINLKEASKTFILKHAPKSLDMLMRLDDSTKN